MTGRINQVASLTVPQRNGIATTTRKSSGASSTMGNRDDEKSPGKCQRYNPSELSSSPLLLLMWEPPWRWPGDYYFHQHRPMSSTFCRSSTRLVIEWRFAHIITMWTFHRSTPCCEVTAKVLIVPQQFFSRLVGMVTLSQRLSIHTFASTAMIQPVMGMTFISA